jgi:superfamily II DNA or RNA helicase
MKKFNVSFSLLNLYKSCERNFYYSIISKEKPTDKVEQKYSLFGNAVHEAIELDKDVWDKYGINDDKLTYDIYKECVEFAKSLKYKYKKKEEVIVFNHKGYTFKGIIDATLDDGSIVDWKTSTYSEIKKEEYKTQLLYYNFLYYMKHGVVPPKSIIVFLKAKKVFEWSFTLDDIKKCEIQVLNALKSIENKKSFAEFKPNYSSCFFCAFKSKCEHDTIVLPNEKMFNVAYDHDWVYITTPMPNKFNSVVSDLLSYEMDNAHFIKRAMAQKGIKDYDTTVRLYNNQKAPLGFKNFLIDMLHKYCEANNTKCIINEIDKRILNHVPIEVPVRLNDIVLRKYQEDAIRYILDKKICMPEVCTGAGKTIMACEIIRRIAKKTLFVVDRNILLNQTVDEFKNHFKSVGKITNGKLEDGDIVVASIQSIIALLKKDKSFKNYISHFGVVIVDEAHGTKAKSYKTMMSYVSAEYRIGLSGTAYSDGNDSLELYRTFGFPDYKIRAIDLINEGYLVMPEIHFLKYEDDDVLFGNYAEVYNQLLESKGRLQALKKVVDEKFMKYNILIMIDKLAHIDIISEYMPKESNVMVIEGKTKISERNKIIDTLKKTKGNVLIATSSIIQKGVDIPTLDVIVNYSANAGSVKTIQSLGRVLRKSDSKDKAWYYDFYDTHSKLKQHTEKRIQALKQQGYEIETFINI